MTKFERAFKEQENRAAYEARTKEIRDRRGLLIPRGKLSEENMKVLRGIRL